MTLYIYRPITTAEDPTTNVVFDQMFGEICKDCVFLTNSRWIICYWPTS